MFIIKELKIVFGITIFDKNTKIKFRGHEAIDLSGFMRFFVKIFSLIIDRKCSKLHNFSSRSRMTNDIHKQMNVVDPIVTLIDEREATDPLNSIQLVHIVHWTHTYACSIECMLLIF